MPTWAIVVIVCVICGTLSGIVKSILASKNGNNAGGSPCPAPQEKEKEEGIRYNVNVDNVDDYIKIKDYEKENMQCPYCGARAGVGKGGTCKNCGAPM